MSSSTSSAPGATRPRSQPAVSSTGSRWARASSTTGKNATAKSTSTMPGCHATTGLPKRRKRKIIAFAYDHPLEGYRPLTFMMLDADVAAASPTSVWRVLHQAGLLSRVHVKTSPYYPQSNGKIERFHRTLKGDCIRTQVPLSLEDARRLVTGYVAHYNETRLHSAIGYLAPKDKLEGRGPEILAARDRKLAGARERRKLLRQTAHQDGAAGPRPSIDFGAVRALITLAEVLALLRYLPTRTRGTQQRGPCPVHGSRQPSRSQCFSANLADNICHCFKCGFGGNALDWWVAVAGQNIYDAAVDLCQRLGRPLPTKETERRPA